jgi:Lipocalin-like domain
MADQAREATGVWMLRSAYLERTDTRERILPYDDNPRGVLILHEGGRMAAIITPSAQTGDVPQERGSIQPDVGPDRPAAA